MKYDFTTLLDRRGKDAIALDIIGRDPKQYTPAKEGFDPIPMWIADMSFPVCPSVEESMRSRLENPTYGYFSPRPEYYQCIIDWQTERNGAEGLTEECIGYENGVLGGVVSCLNVFCSRGDKVLVHSPTYVGFTGVLTNNGFSIVHSPLKKDENGVYRMDFDDMEAKLRDQSIHTAIFCSPHNPCGRVWERWEIEQAMALYEKYDVKVISDEIWSDIILNGNRHIPTQSVSPWARENVAAMYAPSKTFSLAGLVGSYHIIYNKALRDRIRKESSLSHYNSMNVLSMYALMGAYSETGREWTDELCSVLSGNVNYAVDYIRGHFEGIALTKPEGTYMLFPDCTEWCRAHGKTIDDVLKAAWDVGVYLQDGRPFHGECHLRLNLALPLSRLKEALDRLDKYVFNA